MGRRRRHALAALFVLAAALAPIAGSPATVAYTSLTPPLRRLVSVSRCQAGQGGRHCPVHAPGLHDGHVPHVEVARFPDARSSGASGASQESTPGTFRAVSQISSGLGQTVHKLAIPVGTAVGAVGRMLVPSTQSLMLAAFQLGIPAGLTHSRVASTLGLLVLRCAGRIRCFLDERARSKEGDVLATDGGENLPRKQCSVWSMGRKVCEVVACETAGALLTVVLKRPRLGDSFPLRENEEGRRLSAVAVLARAQRISGQRWVPSSPLLPLCSTPSNPFTKHWRREAGG